MEGGCFREVDGRVRAQTREGEEEGAKSYPAVVMFWPGEEYDPGRVLIVAERYGRPRVSE